MYVVITTVSVKPGSVDAVRKLFAETNPGLVEGQTEWVEAKFTANRAEDRVSVLAFWRDADAYRNFSAGEEFRQVMGRFAPHFAGPPEVSINEVLFEM